MSDSPRQTAGDSFYRGMVSNQNPVTLEEGYLQFAGNMRIDRGVATTRKGTKRLVSGFQVSQAIHGASNFTTPTGTELVLLVGDSRLWVYNTQTHTVASYAYPAGRFVTFNDAVHILQALHKAYILRGSPSGMAQPCTISRTGGTATVTLAQHGFRTGDEVTLYGAEQPEYNGSHLITRTASNTFAFPVTGAPASPATGSCLALKCKPALVFDGSTVDLVSHTKGFDSADSSFPPADFGLYFSNRIVVKVGRDKLAVSDYLDFDTWDQTLAAWEINLGDNDEIVGVTPFAENQFLIFKRRSIYIARLQNDYSAAEPALATSSYVQTVTDQVGCCARNTIANAGEAIFFLSDTGVRVLDPQLDLKLLGNSVALSDPISDIIERINMAAVANAVGRVFNNRYYLAVPLDTSAYNNAVLVYNLTNKAWESVDTYPDGVRLDGLIVAEYTPSLDECDGLDAGIGCMAIEVNFIMR